MAGVGPEEIVDAAELALRLIGPESIGIYDRLPSGARLRRGAKGYEIQLRDGLPDINFACAHELAHWALREIARYSGPDEERLANYVGAALLSPRALVRAGAIFYGRKLEAVEPLAEATWMSRTAANLRLGEVIGDGRVVVTKSGNVLRSSEASFARPDRDIRADARAAHETPGVARAHLRGGIDDGRVALRER